MTKYGDDFISKAEFRYLMIYLREYYIYWAVFNEVDANKDKKVTPKEFQKAAPMLQGYGVTIPDVKELFATVDKDKSGWIDFDQFVHWTLKNKLKFNISQYGY